METEEVSVNTIRLDVINKGTTFFNIAEKSISPNRKKYHLQVNLETRQNLKEKSEEIAVEDNLPIREYGYWRQDKDDDVDEFLAKLKRYVSRPLGKVIIPLKSKVSSYDIGIKDTIREETIDFDDIDISVGELARKKLKEKGIVDFEGEIKKILSNQTEDNAQEKVNAYVVLKDRISALKNLIGRNSSYSYSYYNEKKDETIKIPLTPEQYNEKMKEIEVDLRVLEKAFGIKQEELDFIKIKDEKDDEETDGEFEEDEEEYED